MEFPGFLGIGLYRLRKLLRDAPMAALGPLFGIMGADIAVDISGGRFGTAIIEVVIGPMIAISISSVAQRENAGPSGLLLFILGSISAIGASILITRGLSYGSGTTFVVGLRHLIVGAYAWAAIASEPPPRREVRVATVGV